MTCGEGVRDRVRVCDDPPPSNGGLNCEGKDQQHQRETCNDYPCTTTPAPGRAERFCN